MFVVADGWCDLPGLQKRGIFLAEMFSEKAVIDMSEGLMDGGRDYVVPGFLAEGPCHSGRTSLLSDDPDVHRTSKKARKRCACGLEMC